jgi:hypothetical protein
MKVLLYRVMMKFNWFDIHNLTPAHLSTKYSTSASNSNSRSPSARQTEGVSPTSGSPSTRNSLLSSVISWIASREYVRMADDRPRAGAVRPDLAVPTDSNNNRTAGSPASGGTPKRDEQNNREKTGDHVVFGDNPIFGSPPKAAKAGTAAAAGARTDVERGEVVMQTI